MFGISYPENFYIVILIAGIALVVLLGLIALVSLKPSIKNNISKDKLNGNQVVLTNTQRQAFSSITIDKNTVIFSKNENVHSVKVAVASFNGSNKVGGVYTLTFDEGQTSIRFRHAVKGVRVEVLSINGNNLDHENIINNKLVPGIVVTGLMSVIGVVSSLFIADFMTTVAPKGLPLDPLLITMICPVLALISYVVISIVLNKAGK